MTRIIFTTYDDIMVTNLIDAAQQRAIHEYFDRLVDNKRQYANLCNADFKLFHNTMGDWDCGDHLNFTKVNLYKHHLMALLAEEYDEVLYVDMDVVFNTTDNIFETIDLSKGIAVREQNRRISSKDPTDVSIKEYGARNPTLKYHIARDLLNGQDNNVINTGLILGRSEHIKQLQFVSRLPDIISKIDLLMNNTFDKSIGKHNHVRPFYYANNESIFSYLLERYNIPYQLLDEEWHTIIDNTPTNDNLKTCKVIHLIHKLFHVFFNDKTKLIFSMYIKINDDKLDNSGTYVWADHTVEKSKHTQTQLEKYYDKLVEEKKQYAKSIGAKFILFENDKQYQDFKNLYPNQSEYDVINLYKIWLLNNLVHEYDLVAYLDFDVHIRKPLDIFATQNCEDMIQCDYLDRHYFKVEFDIHYMKSYDHDFRNPQSKYWNTKAMLIEEDCDDVEAPVYNTGVVVASKRMMEQLSYFVNIDDTLDLMTAVKNDEYSMFLPNMRNSFGYDNETIFAYKVAINNVPVNNIKKEFHHKHSMDWDLIRRHNADKALLISRERFEAEMAAKDPIFVHFISKQFELVFD